MHVVVSPDRSEGVNPAIAQQYTELFDSPARSASDQKKFVRITGDLAEEAIGYNGEELAKARKTYLRGVCALSSGAMALETADLIFEQSLIAYGRQLVDTLAYVGQHADEMTPEIASVGETVKAVSTKIIGTETLERVRTMNEVFVDTFHERNKVNPRLKRAANYVKFVAKYPDRPSHILLKDSPGSLDIPAAEVAYADVCAKMYAENFSAAVQESRALNQTPDITAFALMGLRGVITHDLAPEIDATQEALGRVL